jgi:rRNA processing protein Krr1/Pno1
MASEAVANGNASVAEGLTPAQKLMEQHEAHHAHPVTIEEVPDEDDLKHPPPSATVKADNSDSSTQLSEKAAGKQKAEDAGPPAKTAAAKAPFNSLSEDFPALGPVKPRNPTQAPTWGGRPLASLTTNGVNGGTNGSATGATTPGSGLGTPVALPGRGVGHPTISLPGKHVERISFAPAQLLPREQMKKPLIEVLRDINRRSKARVELKAGPGGSQVFEGTGPVDAVRQALKEVANELGSKQSLRIGVPASVRAHIIGRQGSKIQEISKRTGARIHVPKQDDSTPEDDDSAVIEVVIEGNALTVEMARREIEAIVNERTSTVNLRLKDIPAELYPFLAGPHNTNVDALEQGRDVRVQIPHYTRWNTQAPPEASRNQPVPFVSQPNVPIHISGDRAAAQEIQAKIERRAQQLRQQLAMEQRSIERGRHQFIVGDRGGSLHDFLKETGCSIILPPNHDDSETIYIVGPPDKIENGVNKLEDLAASMQMAMVDCAREHRGARAQEHARNLTNYLRSRRVIEELERQHEASIVAPSLPDGPTAWEIYARNGKNTMKARGDIMSVFAGHPPGRFASVSVDPFYHQYLQQRNAEHIRDQMGVHVVFPEDSESSPELILVFEGNTPATEYTIPRGAPAPSEIRAYQQGLQQAQQFIKELTNAQQSITSRDLEAPPKFYEKIRRYVDREQQNLPQDAVPAQVLFGPRRPEESRRRSDAGVSIRGPTNAVEELASKIRAFIEQEERDELERGFTTTFDFPQKFANFLIGKRGENIRKLREEFDVDIQVNDGKVELKGPQAKANAAKAHILALAKKLEDEATHVLKIKSQYHRDLIGPKGSQVNRLQDRYNVRINFPRTAVANNDDDAATEGGASQRNYRTQAPDEVIIRGPRRGADEAREELLNLYQWTMDNSYTDSVSVAQSQIPSLIGSGGREMENLRAMTGCQIDVPGVREAADPSGRAEIRLKGTKKQVEEAKKLLQERAKVFDDTVVKTIDVDKKHHRSLIGTSGANIRNIVTAAGGPDNNRDLARMVRFPRADAEDSTIRVEGPKAVVEKIIASIEQQAATLDNQVTETIDVSPEKHRLLIGRGGETRRNIESQFAIQLDIPKQNVTGPARNHIKITGEPSAVKSAKEHILDLVKGQEGETVQVPSHLHHVISDNGRFFRRLRSEYKVTVDHAGHQIPARQSQAEGGKSRKSANGSTLPLITDEDTTSGAEEKHSWEVVDNNPSGESTETIPWILRGPADNLAKALQALEAALEAASKPSCTGYLILPDPRVYRHVVGRGGATVDGIRKKTGTKVHVPKDQKDEAISITGTKDGVEEARRLILEAVSEGENGARRS